MDGRRELVAQRLFANSVQLGQSEIEGGALLFADGSDGATIKGFGTRFQVDW
jgi:hypothetical protein